MIDTAFIRIERAAEKLDTDVDTLLLLAQEGRIRIYGLLNREVYAEYGGYFDEYEDGTPAWEPERSEFRHFTYVPLFSKSLGDLLVHGEVSLLGEPLSDIDVRMRSWRSSGDSVEGEPLMVRKNALFVKPSALTFERAEALADAGARGAARASTTTAMAPERGSSSATTRVKHTLLVIIAALAKEASIDVRQRGAAARIEELVQALGSSLTQDTIKRYLDQIPQALDTRSE